MHKYHSTTPLALFFAILFVLATSTNAKAENLNSNSLTITVDQYSETIPTEILDEWITHNNQYYLSSKDRSEFENSSYCPVNKVFCALTLTLSQKQHIRLAPQTIVNESKIKSYVEDLAKKVNRQPSDAKFKVEDGIVGTFEEAKYGITLDVDKSTKIIADAINNKKDNSLSLPFDSEKPNSNYGDVNNMGISALLGEGVSNFKGSPKNRIHNVQVAAQRYNGMLIKPGEEFSFVKNLGEVDGEHGYLPELVIKKNVTEPEFGGGICQVSTTAFRAAIHSGLKITARHNHAYPVSYYNPQGMDSTVYVPNPDLRFINNTPNYILIQTKIVGTVLTFDFYGTDDGRKTTVDGPYITEKQPDGSLKAQFTQHVFDKDGKEIINDVFKSSYNSPFKYPHLGGPTLSTKPSNWSDDEWKTYKQTVKDIAKAAAAVKP